MTKTLFPLLLGAFFCVTPSAYSQPPGRGMGEGPPGGIRGGADRDQEQAFGGNQNLLMQAIDTNGDGELSRSEIRNAAKALRKMDTDDNGTLDQEELGLSATGGRGMMRQGPQGAGPQGVGPPGGGPLGEQGFGEGQQGRRGGQRNGGPPDGGASGMGDSEKIISRMMEMDQDNDGNLSPDEVPEQMRRMLQRADQDRDGMISESELEAFAEKTGQNQRGNQRGQNRR